MSPTADTPDLESTVSHHIAPSPEREKLTAALRAYLSNSAPVQAFLDCLEEHAADVPTWIEADLWAHFAESWKSTDATAWPRLDRYAPLFPEQYAQLLKDTYVACRRAAETDCPNRRRFTVSQADEAG